MSQWQFSGRRLVGQVGLLTVANIVARLFSAVGMILVARLLGPAEYGPFAGSLALTRVLSVFFNLGLDIWLLRDGGQNEAELGRKVGALFTLKMGAGFGWLVAMRLLVTWLNPESFPVGLFMWCALAVWLEDVALTAGSAFQAALQPQKTAVVTVVVQALFLLITVAMWGVGVVQAITYAWGRAGMGLLAMGWAMWLMSRSFALYTTRADVQIALRGARAFAVSLGLAMVARQADVSIVANWLGKTAAGLYAPAVTLASTVLLLSMSMHNVILPSLSRLYSQNPRRLPRTVSQLLLGAGGLALVLVVGIWLTAEWLVMWLYGAEYAISGQILQILGLVIFVRSFTAILGAVLAAVHWQRKRVYVQAVGVAFSIGLDLYVVTQTTWGIFGVAWVYVAAELVLMLGYSWYVWHWVRVMNNKQ